MKKFGLVLLIAAAVSGEVAAASFATGNKLLKDCQSTDVVERNLCLGYIAGIFDALDGNTLDQQHRACLPKGVTIGQVSDIVVQWLQANPKDRHYAAAGLVAAAIAKAFPCR
jgi:hypothetical protein